MEQEVKTARGKLEELQKATATQGAPADDDTARVLLDLVNSELKEHFEKGENEVKAYFHSLKARNESMQREIIAARRENTGLQQNLLDLQERLKLLEVALGE